MPAGRPTGSKDRAPRMTAALKQALAFEEGGGITPLQLWRRILLEKLAVYDNPLLDTPVREAALSVALAVADKAAPYIHQRQAQAVQVSGEDGGPILTVGITTTDPQEAAQAYIDMMRSV